MDASTFHASSSIIVAAPPEDVYDFIAAMTTMGKISPECTGGAWENESRGVGAIFIGSNTTPERTWQRRMRIAVADAPREFVFEHMGDAAVPASSDDEPMATWGYTFTPDEGGTKVQETWQLLDHPRLETLDEQRMRERQESFQAGIEQTLASLKKVLES